MTIPIPDSRAVIGPAFRDLGATIVLSIKPETANMLYLQLVNCQHRDSTR